MDKVVKTFEDLIRRYIAPSSSFCVLLLAGHILCIGLLPEEDAARVWNVWKEGYGMLVGAKSASLVIFVFLLILTGLSYVLATLDKVFLDNSLKGNFNGFFFFKGDNRRLDALRKKTIARLNVIGDFEDVDLTDYLLYRILDRVDRTDYTRLIDSAKSFGLVLISLVLVTTHLYVYYWDALGNSVWTAFAVVPLLCMLTRETVKGRYRTRALKLYINMIGMDDDELRRTNRVVDNAMNDLLKAPFQVTVTSLPKQ